ncbi:toxin-antitoxin system YwqK family antitoxin [Thermoflexibacter ruber]|uniref:Antitoxin component YwqK of the YwqJK toxin-antitoxin module n=1 Tax=Thermoflexibacter ruber TaxID=1003 RepID=A0A1I2K814_9BACT|nr:toxin-antitoxin system YwqK family antitoxin [Thermoflexibacter ruber]SFF62459.1 Antitoxin component YwqK of the YwqJK toxin-antitoxin module [Thermoflexibacter ruber]
MSESSIVMKSRNLLFTFILLFLSCQSQEEYYYEYHENGKVKCKIKRINQIANGEAIWYHPNGNIATKATMVNDKIEGVSYHYSEDGKLISIDSVRNGKAHGKILTFYPNGNTKSLGSFKNGKAHGKILTFYPNGNIKSVESFKNGKLNGENFYYAEEDSGRLVKKNRAFVIQDSAYYISATTYDVNGKIKQRGALVYVEMEKDTVHLGENFKAKLTLMNAQYDSCELHYGDFDEDFVLQDSTSEKVVIVKGNEAQIILKPHKLGKNYLRGYMKDFVTVWTHDKKRIKQYKFETIIENAPKESNLIVVSSTIGHYFEYEYFVVDK